MTRPVVAWLDPATVRAYLTSSITTEGQPTMTRTPSRPARPVRKASGEQIAVYDQNGVLQGTCLLSAVKPLAQHPASKPDKPANSVPASLAREVNTKQSPPDTLQPQPAADAGVSRAQVAKAARRAGVAVRDGVEADIIRRAEATVRLAKAQGQTPAGVELAKVHAAGRAATELQQHRAERAAARSVQVRKADGPADPVLADGYQAYDRARSSLTNSTPAPANGNRRNPNVDDEERSWDAARAALQRLRGGA
jgi:hypothetical protein